MDGRAVIAKRFRGQARQCTELGSPLYAGLMERAAQDAEAGGLIWDVCRGHEGDPGEGALALRLFGAMHLLALEGRAPDLAAVYPSCGGGLDEDGDPWPAFHATVEANQDRARQALDQPAQTNEVGRTAGLLGGFLTVAAATRKPLRLLEVGASAGLLLRWDHYRYTAAGGWAWGPAQSPLVLEDAFTGEARPPAAPQTVEVAARKGCDLHPLDVTTAEGERLLAAYVWPDMAGRLQRLRAACAVARQVPVTLERMDAVEWLARELAETAEDTTTVVYHSVFMQYLDPGHRQAVQETIEAAATATTRATRAPLAWLRFEPANRRMEITLTMWPPGTTRLLAHAPAHGLPATWLSE
jgi:hypothetical protein